MTVVVRSIHYESDVWCEEVEAVEVWIGDQMIGEGSYGGEPEDNRRDRDYSWVEPLLCNLAKALGAEVELVEETGEEDE